MDSKTPPPVTGVRWWVWVICAAMLLIGFYPIYFAAALFWFVGPWLIPAGIIAVICAVVYAVIAARRF
jgi:hypothetical protein